MSVRALDEALSLPNEFVTSTEKFAAVVVANYVNQDGQAWPYVNTVAETIGKSRDTAARALRGLVRKGVLVRVVQGGGARDQEDTTRPNLYVWNAKEAVERWRAGAGDADPGADQVDLPVHTPPTWVPVVPPPARTPDDAGRPPAPAPRPEPPAPASQAPSPKQARPTRGTRLPADFTVTPQMRDWAARTTPDVNIGAETERFTDYWVAAPGQRGVKTDWTATWRNWMRKAQEQAPAQDRPAPSPVGGAPDAVRAARAEIAGLLADGRVYEVGAGQLSVLPEAERYLVRQIVTDVKVSGRAPETSVLTALRDGRLR